MAKGESDEEGGFVVYGRLLRGHLGLAGHVGHLPNHPGGRLCFCGMRGHWEAEASGSAFQQKAIEAGFDSLMDLMQKARDDKPAERIGASDAEPAPGLREIDVGQWTGRPIDDIVADDHAAYLGWRAGTVTPPGGETWHSFADRVCGVIEAQNEAPCDNLLVVCHGGVIRAVLQRFLQLEPANIIPVGPGSLTAMRLANGTGKPHRLELFNYWPDRLEFEAPD